MVFLQRILPILITRMSELPFRGIWKLLPCYSPEAIVGDKPESVFSISLAWTCIRTVPNLIICKVSDFLYRHNAFSWCLELRSGKWAEPPILVDVCGWLIQMTSQLRETEKKQKQQTVCFFFCWKQTNKNMIFAKHFLSTLLLACGFYLQ